MRWTLDNSINYTDIKYGLKDPISKTGSGKFVYDKLTDG